MIVRRKASLENTLRQLVRRRGLPASPSGSRATMGDLAELESKGTHLSSVLTVAHGLGVVPADIQLTPMASEAGEEIWLPVVIQGSVTATQFKIRIRYVGTPAAGGNYFVYWRAST